MPIKLPPMGPRKNTARLAWESKPRREVGPRDLEFQTAEVVYPNPAQAQQKLPIVSGGEVDIRSMNRLIWGDCLLAMQALLSQGYEGKTDLIYIDPPFLTSEDYFFELELEEVGEVTKEPSIIERLAYTDTWIGGTDSYLNMLFPRLQLMRRLLTDQGSIYVHMGPNMNHYVKVLLDEVFGPENFRNEIVWKRTGAHNDPGRYGANIDVVLFYSKSDKWTWNPIYQPHDAEYAARFRFKDPDGRLWTDDNLTAKGLAGGGYHYTYKGVTSDWRCPVETMQRLDAEGRLEHAVRIAVGSAEAPPELLAQADLVVDGPAGLVSVLEELARAATRTPR